MGARAGCIEAGGFESEVQDFRRRIIGTDRVTFVAREGAHNYLVLTIALACWWAALERPVIRKLKIKGYWRTPAVNEALFDAAPASCRATATGIKAERAARRCPLPPDRQATATR